MSDAHETTRDALDAAIETHPDQASNYLVLADWLQQRQDPRGELIIRSRAKDRDSKAACAAMQRAIGPAIPRFGSMDWFYGFVRSVMTVVGDGDGGELRALLDHPSLRFLTSFELRVPGGEHDQRQWVIDAIAERPRTCWRNLVIDSYLRGGNQPGAGDLELGPLWARLPRLEKLRVRARRIDLGALASPALRSLELDGEVGHGSLEPLLDGAAPALKQLILWDVAPELAARVAPAGLALEKLEIHEGVVDRYDQTGE